MILTTNYKGRDLTLNLNTHSASWMNIPVPYSTAEFVFGKIDSISEQIAVEEIKRNLNQFKGANPRSY